MDEKKNIASIIKSLDKNYRKAKINGILNNTDVAYLDILFTILNKCPDKLTQEYFVKFRNEYFKILNNSEQICKSNFILEFKNNKIAHFTQSEVSDCNELPDIKENNIYYWQENDPKSTPEEILSIINKEYFISKNKDTFQNFNIGKTINYSLIGKIVFVHYESNGIDYVVSDILGNNITGFFTITKNIIGNYTSIISNNTYISGDIFIKINKT